MTESDWAVIAVMAAGLVMFASTAADLSASMFGRRTTSGLVRRLREGRTDGPNARTTGGAAFGLFLLAVSQLVPVLALAAGLRPQKEPVFLTATTEVVLALASMVVVARGTRAY